MPMMYRHKSARTQTTTLAKAHQQRHKWFENEGDNDGYNGGNEEAAAKIQHRDDDPAGDHRQRQLPRFLDRFPGSAEGLVDDRHSARPLSRLYHGAVYNEIACKR